MMAPEFVQVPDLRPSILTRIKDTSNDGEMDEWQLVENPQKMVLL